MMTASVNRGRRKWRCLVLLTQQISVVAMLCTIGMMCTAPAFAQRLDSPKIVKLEDTENLALINLGILGVRVEAEKMERGSCDARSNHATVRFLFKGSPGAQHLKEGDVIVGVNGKEFKDYFSRRMAKELNEAGVAGELKLHIKRAGKLQTVEFKNLPKVGAFAKNYPYDCAKSDHLVRQSLDHLVYRQQPNGSMGRYTVLTSVTGLAWLASGDNRYSPALRKLADFLIAEADQNAAVWSMRKLGNWDLAYSAIFLSEYYLKTKDRRVPPILRKLYRSSISTQFANQPAEDLQKWDDGERTMSPQWWGHGPLSNQDPYPHLGVIVATNMISFGLMSECGVEIDMKNVDSILGYIAKLSPSGAMSYASAPYNGGLADEFGRTGALATGLLVLNRHPKQARQSVRALTRTGLGIEHALSSHALSGMGKWWGFVALSRADPKGFRKVMDYYQYDFELARMHDGRFVWNPRATWGYAQFGMWESYKSSDPDQLWTTAFNSLILSIPRQELFLMNGGDAKRR